MSGMLNINFEEVPNEILPVPAGIYQLLILTAPTIEPTVKGIGQKIVVDMQIADEGENLGRRISDHISVKMTTKIKRLALSAGIPVGAEGLDLTMLEGQTVTAKVVTRTYVDPVSGETKETSSVADYIIPV